MEPDGVPRHDAQRLARAGADGPVHRRGRVPVRAPQRDGRALEGRDARPRPPAGRGRGGLGRGRRVRLVRADRPRRRRHAVHGDGACDDGQGRGLRHARLQRLDEPLDGREERGRLDGGHQGRAGALQRPPARLPERQPARQAAEPQVHLRLRREARGVGVRLAVLRAAGRFGGAGRLVRVAHARGQLRQAGRADARLDHRRRRGRVRALRPLRPLPLPGA